MSTSARVSPPNGVAPTIRSVMALQGEVWDSFWSLYSTMWNDGVLDHRTKEIARMRNARTTDCGYCRQVRFAGAQDEGLGESVIDQIVDGYESGPLPEDRKILLRWVDEFLTRPGEGPASVRHDLQALVGADGEAELACAVALFRAFAKVVISLGLEPEPGEMPISRHATPGTTDPATARTGTGMSELGTAVVTGAAQGIGTAIAQRLLADGFDVLLVDRDPKVASTAERLGGRSTVVDITDDAQVATLAELAPDCRVLVNNAALQTPGVVSLLDVDRASALRMFDVNVLGLLAVTRVLAPVITANGGGSVVNLSSTTARSHAAGTGVYAITKAAIDQLTRALAVELGSLGIRCNAVAPGATPTEGSADHYGDAEAQMRRAAPLPLARLGTPSDIADAVSYFASTGSAYVTGQCLAVDGGLLAASGNFYRLARK